jgi:hypothetical protein
MNRGRRGDYDYDEEYDDEGRVGSWRGTLFKNWTRIGNINGESWGRDARRYGGGTTTAENERFMAGN